MGLFDEAKDMLGRGVDMAGNAVDSMTSVAGNFALEAQPFMREFARTCTDGSAQGWHEANGGNLSYRLTPQDIEAATKLFAPSPAEWTPLGTEQSLMGGEFLLLTASGCHMRNVAANLRQEAGIIEVNATGDAYRVVWGFENGHRPTSEVSSHVLCHGVRMQASDGASRVLYHAHPAQLVALTMVLPAQAKEITRALWGSMTECAVVFPGGVGVVPWVPPCGPGIATKTAQAIEEYPAVIWAVHGMFTSGASFDETFGMMQTADKAAGIYLTALAACGGDASRLQLISDDGLRAMAREIGLPLNENFLDKPLLA